MYLSKKILILLLLIFLSIFTVDIYAESNYNWQELIDTTQSQLESNRSDIVLNYTLAVAYANTGEVVKAYEIIDVFGNNVSREEFNQALDPYLKNLATYQNRDNLLLLNYAAFAEVINRNYDDAVDLFEYIIELDPDNLWAYNNAAAALVEIEEFDKAMNYADKALRMQNNEYSHLIKGLVYYKRGNYVRALFQATRSRSLFRALAEDEYQDFMNE